MHLSQLHRLLYASNAAPGADSADLDRIVEASRTNNARVGITGCLMQVGDQYIQVLEGSGREIEAVFERICCDFRHRDVRLIDFVAVKDRLFGDWDMGLIDHACSDSIEKEDLQEVRFLLSVNAREAIRRMRTLLKDDALDSALAA